MVASASRRCHFCCRGRSMRNIAGARRKGRCTTMTSSILHLTESNRAPVSITHVKTGVQETMRTGKAAVYEAPNTPFILKEFPVRPARRGEVLVRVTMSTICRSDIHSYEGRRPNPCPGILGHEIIGIIEEIGEGIDKDMRGRSLSVGDRITWSEYFFDGQCYYREVLDMPQKCHGVRKYGHDYADEDPHFLGG